MLCFIRLFSLRIVNLEHSVFPLLGFFFNFYTLVYRFFKALNSFQSILSEQQGLNWRALNPATGEI